MKLFLLNKLSLINVTLVIANFFSATRQIPEIKNLSILENSSYKNKWWSKKLLVLLKNSIKIVIFGVKIMLYFLAKTAFLREFFYPFFENFRPLQGAILAE